MELTFLSSAVQAEVSRLGGQWKAQTSGEAVEKEGYLIPGAIAHFLYHIRWPKQTYFSDENSAIWVWMLELGVTGWLDPEEIPIRDRGERTLFYFGLADGGNYFLVMDVKDSHPDDPQVYSVDHSDPDQRLHTGAALSEFLRELNPETGEHYVSIPAQQPLARRPLRSAGDGRAFTATVALVIPSL